MKIEQLRVEDAAERLDEFLVVDVRDEHEFRGPLGHVPGSVLHPLAELPAALAGVPKDRALLLTCRSGRRSQRACELLAEAGHSRVANLEGGLIAWNDAALPIHRATFASLWEVIDSAVAYLMQVTPATRDAVMNSLSLLLEEAGASLDEPSAGALEWALQELAEGARQVNPPADLELSLAAWRRDLAVL